jgi:hypothetical protein
MRKVPEERLEFYMDMSTVITKMVQEKRYSFSHIFSVLSSYIALA